MQFSTSIFRHLAMIFTLAVCTLSIFYNVASATTVLDASTRQPLPKASIFDYKGNFIAVTDNNGVIPSTVSKSAFPINIRYVGYNPVDVENPAVETVELEEAIYTLPEITIDDKSRNMLDLTAYVREYGSGTTDTDSIIQYSEQIVDFMLPRTKKAKFKGWKDARVLAERSYREKITNGKDTFTYHENDKGRGFGFKYMDKYILPDAIAAGNSISETIMGKHFPKEEWKVRGDHYYLRKDELADKKDHKISPVFAKMLGMTMDFNTQEYTYVFDGNKDGRKIDKEFTAEDVTSASGTWEIVFSGKVTKWAFESKEPVIFNHYAEVFIIDRAYLTADEARELKKNPPIVSMQFKAPENIPPAVPAMAELKAKVIEAVPKAH